jgi:stage III sporulation protein AA
MENKQNILEQKSLSMGNPAVELPFLPPSLRRLLEQLPVQDMRQTEELRVRRDRPLEWIGCGVSRFITGDGRWTDDPRLAYRPGKDDCLSLLDLLTRHSLYSYEEELKRGFITAAGGHRVGLAGKAVLEQGNVKLLRDISGFNIRLARERPGMALPILPLLYDPVEKELAHTLIISPPQQGKTTLLRDMARLISAGGWTAGGAAARSRKVGIVDERSEIAGCVDGVPRYDVGPRTDVLDGCPKAEGMMMMIRSMSPEVLLVDEVGRAEDAAAIEEALHAGIRVIATAHGRGPEDAARRPVMRELMKARVFNRFVVPRRVNGETGISFTIYDIEGRRLASGP